ncbi:unnamed protein product [Xylocopa violacea]|uniref:Meiosis-specific nuclear structural protein 1 n=1 Tax=Xylocopa violacea TaxID=135666 RepID=A0ABP1NBJ1_XYLVO
MIRGQDGAVDKEYERIRDEKAAEMEERRRAMEKRCEKTRELREFHMERMEATKAERLECSKKAADLKLRQLERTERLAEELARRKHIEQQELLKCRKAKYTVPSIPNETLEKVEAELMEEKRREEEIRSSTMYSPWHFKEDSEMEQQERRLSYRRDLQNQMIENRRRLREMEEEKHRERKIMEGVGEVMYREDLEAEKRKKETAALLQAEREAFLKAREFWKEKRKEVLKQEHDEISRIIVKREALEKREAEGMSDTRAAKDEILEKLMNKLTEEERKRREREELCRELYLAEKENELSKETIKLAMEKKRIAKELLRDMARNQRAMAEKKAKENAIDTAFAKYLADEQRKQEEKERQKEEMRREKAFQYATELREIITKNRMQQLKNVTEMQSDVNMTDQKHKMKCYSESTLDTMKAQQTENNLC